MFFWLGVFVLLLACASPWRLARVPWPFAQEPGKLLFLAIVLASPVAALVAGLVIEVAAAIVRGRIPRPMLFVRNLRGSARHAVPGLADAAAARVAQRLEALGFTYTAHVSPDRPGAIELRAAKAADPQQQGFIESKFDATVTLTPTGSGTDVAATVTSPELTLIETGERERLQALAEHLCLGRDAFEAPTVPLLAYSALLLSLVPLIWLTFADPRPGREWIEGGVLTACSVGGFAFAIVAAIYIRRKPGKLFGLRLAALTVLLAVVPYALKLAETSHTLFRPRRGMMALSILPLFVIMMAPIFIGEFRLRRRFNAGTAGGFFRRGATRLMVYGTAFALFLLGTAAMIHLEARGITELRTVDVSEMEAGSPIPSRWLRVHGTLDLDRARWKGRGGSFRHYIPLVSDIDRNPVAVVLELREAQFENGELFDPTRATGEFEGVVASLFIDEKMRAGFESNGTELTDNAVTLEYQLTPQAYRRRAVAPMWIGLAAAGVVGVVYLLARLSDRRRPNPVTASPEVAISPDAAARR